MSSSQRQQLLDLLGGVALDRDVVVGAQGDFGETGRQARGFHRRLHVREGVGRGEHVDGAVVRITDTSSAPASIAASVIASSFAPAS